LGPLSLGAAQPPPAEATTPEPYITPGLDVSGAPPAASAQLPAPAVAVGAPFAAKGAIFGQPAAAAHIIFQADNPVTLVIHGPAARCGGPPRGPGGPSSSPGQLGGGQAYAAPDAPTLSVEVSNPAIVSVYIARALRGPLQAPMTALSSLSTLPPPPHP